MSKVSVLDVAKYILEKQNGMTTMKLQKLAYYSHAWHLAWTDEPLIAESFRAWRNGPVCWELFDVHRGWLRIDATEFPRGDSASLSSDQKASVDAVLAAYGGLSGGQLSELTHLEHPWKNVRALGIGDANANDVIGNEVLKDFFRTQMAQGVEIEKVHWLKS